MDLTVLATTLVTALAILDRALIILTTLGTQAALASPATLNAALSTLIPLTLILVPTLINIPATAAAGSTLASTLATRNTAHTLTTLTTTLTRIPPLILLLPAVISLPTPAAATGTLGFALGTKNPDGSCKSTSDYEADFDAIYAASGSRLVRGYSASDCGAAQNILPAARSRGFRVVLGVWPDVPASLAADKAALMAHAWRYPDQVYAVTVGSETLYRGNFTGEELLAKINEVRAVLPEGVKVGTADSWNKWADGTGDAVVRGGVDLILVNAFAYWQGQNITNATKTYFDDIAQAFGRIQDVSGSFDTPEIWNGETGWPKDGGSDFGLAHASTANAATYFQTAVCGMLAWGVDVFCFEAFDEPWKPRSLGDNGKWADETHWGAMTAGREVSYGLRCVPPSAEEE